MGIHPVRAGNRIRAATRTLFHWTLSVSAKVWIQLVEIGKK